MSPEGMIDHIYGMKTDIWAFGIIFYELLHGKTPFSYCTSEYDLKKAVMTQLSFNNFRPDMSPEARKLILKCLIVDSQIRPDAISLKQDIFIQHLINFNQNRRNITHLDTHSMQMIPHHANEFRKLETGSSSSSNQKISQ
jgi:serine/threonine protein kinase